MKAAQVAKPAHARADFRARPDRPGPARPGRAAGMERLASGGAAADLGLAAALALPQRHGADISIHLARRFDA
ncbi:MAG: hypothetical protein KGL18_02475 [Burkholderiales bacterium]|nr:hypothetical protein [Burkholderiales bacterium]MDE1926157.1 hypothetical protein [Burkholderiales bacterium]MDE2158044.1 hypothetical protein [Burkholderiales bacterium]MDE2501833.1 hypothetical protein [Burkholderiales bacterium]